MLKAQKVRYIMYTVPKFQFEKLEKRIKNILAAFDAAGIGYIYKVVGTVIKPITVRYELDNDFTEQEELVECIEFELTADTYNVEGYQMIACVEATAEDNIVYPMTEDADMTAYRHIPMFCEHCKVNRRRNKVVVMRDYDGNEIVVGRNCMKNFLPVNVEAVLRAYEEINAIIYRATENCAYEADDIVRIPRYYDTKKYLAYCIEATLETGYTKTIKEDAWKDLVTRRRIDDKYMDIAQQVIDFFEKMNADSLNDFENNVRITVCGYKPLRYANGFIAYAYTLYQKMTAKQAEEQAKTTSKHIGTVGQKIEVIGTLRPAYTYETAYGYTTIWEIIDEAGNKLIWKTGTGISATANGVDGKKFKIVGTVKAHTEYKGTAQTELTRCKVALFATA